jgi:hypothetical protein
MLYIKEDKILADLEWWCSLWCRECRCCRPSLQLLLSSAQNRERTRLELLRRPISWFIVQLVMNILQKWVMIQLVIILGQLSIGVWFSCLMYSILCKYQLGFPLIN